jgi:hypothetical protein
VATRSNVREDLIRQEEKKYSSSGQKVSVNDTKKNTRL